MTVKKVEDEMEKYWRYNVTFSLSSASIGLMIATAFPTAHAGWHTTIYLYTLQSMRNDLMLTSIPLSEPIIHASAGFIGCILAVGYEWATHALDENTFQAYTPFLQTLIYHKPYKPA